jgi:thiamine biosynthesis lipoprotein
VAANTASTAAVVLGQAAVPWLDRRDVTARLVAADGAVRVTGRWPLRAAERWAS